MTIEIRHLRCFIAVAEKLHFTLAAEELHLAQPALSHQIQRLEATLRVRLLDRTTRAVVLTEAGRQFLAQAKAAVAAYDEALDTGRRLGRGEAGRVTIGTNPRTRHHLVSTVTSTVRERCPGVAADILTEATSLLVDDVRTGRLDIAICLCPVRTPDLRVEMIRAEPVFVAMASGHPLAGRARLTLADLSGERWLLPSDRKAIGYNSLIQDRCSRWGYDIIVAPEAPDYDDAFSLVTAGKGIELAPQDFVGDREFPGVTFVPMTPDNWLPMSLVWRAGNADAVVTQVVNAVRAIPDQLGWRLRQQPPAGRLSSPAGSPHPRQGLAPFDAAGGELKSSA
jgi:DNA-binding transcriptional LysR family regulator